MITVCADGALGEARCAQAAANLCQPVHRQLLEEHDTNVDTRVACSSGYCLRVIIIGHVCKCAGMYASALACMQARWHVCKRAGMYASALACMQVRWHAARVASMTAALQHA